MKLSSRLVHTDQRGDFCVYQVRFFDQYLHWINVPIQIQSKNYGYLFLTEEMTPGFYYVYEKNSRKAAWTGFFYWDGDNMHDLVLSEKISSEALKKIRSFSGFSKKPIHHIIADISSRFYSEARTNYSGLNHLFGSSRKKNQPLFHKRPIRKFA